MATIKDSAPALARLPSCRADRGAGISMLDDIEGALLRVLRTVDEETP
jgi:hypothetical protein